ncbi:hypothetical protein H311_02303, partial [Anncaliia algerae PRA109]
MISKIYNKILYSNKHLLTFFIIYRIINSFFLFTMFEPDEFFQNIEPITYLLSGRNSLSWDILVGIRSINYSLIFYLPLLLSYKLNSITLAYVSVKFMNGIIAGLNDYFTVKIGQLYNIDAVPITVLHHGLWLYSSRSHINSFEMFICTSSYYFLEKFKRSSAKNKRKESFYLRLFLYLSLIGTFLRPSAFIMNLIPFMYCVYNMKLSLFLLTFIPELILILLTMIYNDYIFYQEFVLVPYNFVKYNVLYNVQELFGTLPFYIYFLFAFVIMGPSLFYYLRNFKKNKMISACALLFYIFYSLQGHKEMRFLIPMIPFVNIIASSSNKKNLFFFYISFIIGVIAGISHQSILPTLWTLNKEISSENKQRNILFLTTPYIFPSFALLANKNVSVKCLSGNPNIFEKVQHP